MCLSNSSTHPIVQSDMKQHRWYTNGFTVEVNLGPFSSVRQTGLKDAISLSPVVHALQNLCSTEKLAILQSWNWASVKDRQTAEYRSRQQKYTLPNNSAILVCCFGQRSEVSSVEKEASIHSWNKNMTLYLCFMVLNDAWFYAKFQNPDIHMMYRSNLLDGQVPIQIDFENVTVM